MMTIKNAKAVGNMNRKSTIPRLFKPNHSLAYLYFLYLFQYTAQALICEVCGIAGFSIFENRATAKTAALKSR